MVVNWSPVADIVTQTETRGTVGVTILTPQGERWSHQGSRKFRVASTVKIPIMLEIFRQIDRGERALTDRHTLLEEEKAMGSGVMLHLNAGLDLTIHELLYLMISISDNTATNLLIRKAGMPAVNATMQELNMTGTNLGREMKGRPAIAGEQENFGTTDDYVAVVGAILDGSAASSDSCAAMRALLEKQQCTTRIARYLPIDERIRWGSKPGSITGVTTDAGYISTPDGTLIISVFCEGMPDQHVGELSIGEITRAALQVTGLVEPLYTS